MSSRTFDLLRLMGLAFLVLITLANTALSQTHSYPDKIRGYKVERTVVEIKKPESKTTSQSKGKAQTNDSQDDSGPNDDADVDQLIRFGQPALARITPLGITFAVPIVVAPVKQKGHVDFLVFEDMTINGRSVEIADYNRSFDLSDKQAITLHEPLRIYIYLPSALLAALGEWTDSQETWPVTGRVYVFGKFKKSILGISSSFKRCVPVELNLTMRNPLRERN
jgi:hypothetical protein